MPHVLVGDEVEVALAIAFLDVGEPMPLLRERAHGLGQERQLVHVNGALARARDERPPRDADEVTQVEIPQ